MASKTALPIARLRALGCRVGHVVGHDPRIGDWKYGVTLPKGIELPLEVSKFNGTARADTIPGEKDRIVVGAYLYRVGKPAPSRDRRAEAERDVAGLLSAIADVLNGR